MRILQLVTARQRRGAEVFATQLSDALAARGHEVVVLGLLPAPESPLTPALAAADDLAAASNGRFDLARLHGVASAVQRLRPDIVQANGSQTLKYSAFTRRLSRHRFPLVYRNISIASQWVRGPAHRLWGRWLAGALDHVSSVSEASSADFGETYRVPAERRSVIRRGILVPATVEAGAARRELALRVGAPPGAALLVHVGNYSEEKNHLWLVGAFRRVLAAVPEAHLVLIGDGTLRPQVEAGIAAQGLQRSVHLLGMRPDAAQLVAGADVFVLPSRIEGIPGVVLEAAAQAVPAVATDVGGMREAVRDGETGMLVPLGDEDGFVAAVLALLADPARRRSMGAAARLLVQQRFSMEATASAFEDLYARLVREGRS
jgi:glycosyltransferase involved in cell wall biosynthesis